MINGFEQQTKELNDYERDVLLPIMVRGLRLKVGENKAVTNNEIITGLKQLGHTKVSQARVRKIINFIRVNGLIKNLVASSRGYWIENSLERRRFYAESIKQRAEAMLALLNHIEL